MLDTCADFHLWTEPLEAKRAAGVNACDLHGLKAYSRGISEKMPTRARNKEHASDSKTAIDTRSM